MKRQLLLLAFLLFQITQTTLFISKDPIEPPDPQDPQDPLLIKCPIHRLYALDSSGSMGGGNSWTLAESYLNSQALSFNNLVSSFKYKNIPNPPLSRDRILNPPSIIPTLGIPSGTANYLTAFNKLKNIITSNSPNSYPEQKFIINIISDGYDPYTLEQENLLNLLKTWKKNACSRTINCVQTKRFSTQSNFEKLCRKLNLHITILEPLTITIIPFIQISDTPLPFDPSK